MGIKIKNAYDVEQMRIACKLAALVLDYIKPYVVAGVSTNKLDQLCHDYIVHDLDSYPSPLNYQPDPSVAPYPKSTCISLNSVICHGIPNEQVLKDGDILNIDITVTTKTGYFGDTSRMFKVGEVSNIAERLCCNTLECLWLGIMQVRPGNTLGDIGCAIQTHAENNGYSVVREFCGHGIGTEFHEDNAEIVHYGRKGQGAKLVEGMIFTIEPMINQGKRDIRFQKDGWVVVTKDRSLSAQYEHTVLVTRDGYEVLTISPEMQNNPFK